MRGHFASAPQTFAGSWRGSVSALRQRHLKEEGLRPSSLQTHAGEGARDEGRCNGAVGPWGAQTILKPARMDFTPRVGAAHISVKGGVPAAVLLPSENGTGTTSRGIDGPLNAQTILNPARMEFTPRVGASCILVKGGIPAAV